VPTNIVSVRSVARYRSAGRPRVPWTCRALDQVGGAERAEVLTHGAGGDPERFGQLVGGGLAVALQRREHASLGGRRCGVGAGHVTSVHISGSFARKNL
jgi:hypothetical protein